MYRNDGNWEFTDVTVAEGIAGGIEGGYDSTWGDLDLDGDQDLIVPNNMGSIASPLPSGPSSATSPPMAIIGFTCTSTVRPTIHQPSVPSLYATINEGTPDEKTLRREANTNPGTFNQSDLPVHFGLGLADVIDELRIRWPNGQMQTLFDVSVDQYLTINIPNPGDFDGNGVVDGRDFLMWQRGESPTPLSASDLADWQANYGNGSLGAVSVPEPNCFCLAMIVATVAVLCRNQTAV